MRYRNIASLPHHSLDRVVCTQFSKFSAILGAGRSNAAYNLTKMLVSKQTGAVTNIRMTGTQYTITCTPQHGRPPLKSCEYAMHKLLSAMHNCFPSCVAWHSPFSHLFSSTLNPWSWCAFLHILGRLLSALYIVRRFTPLTALSEYILFPFIMRRFSNLFAAFRTLPHSFWCNLSTAGRTTLHSSHCASFH